MTDTKAFQSVLYGVSPRLREALTAVRPAVQASVREIRIRLDLPLALTADTGSLFVWGNGQTSPCPAPGVLRAKKEELAECFRLLTESSVYAHTEELSNGYIVMRSGSRAGVFGTLTPDGLMHSITALNLRIAHEMPGAADSLLGRFENGLLIAGPPGSGKTTVLRDLIRRLSGSGFYKRICVIDSRGELSGNGACDLGATCDVLVTDDKAKGVEIATRTMNPQIVALDEIASAQELARVTESFYCGTQILTTAHVGSPGELLLRSVTRDLLTGGAVSHVAFLPRAGAEPIFFTVKELTNEACGQSHRYVPDFDFLRTGGIGKGVGA